MADMRICEAVATQASLTLGILNAAKCLGITCNIYGYVCLRCGVREKGLFSCR